jgi:hypothetical protein
MAPVRTDVSEDHIAYFIRVKRNSVLAFDFFAD